MEVLRPEDGEDLHKRAVKLLEDSIMELVQNMSSSLTTTTTESTSTEGDGEDDDTHGLSKMALLRMRRSKKSSAMKSNESMEERVKKAVKLWSEQTFVPEYELRQQRKRMKRGADDIDWKKVGEGDTLYISSVFDSLEWWLSIGNSKHPEVFLVMLQILALPASNAFLERVFSICTWFDDPLRQNLKFKRLEMSVLLAVNEVLLDANGEVPDEDDAKEIVEKVIGIFESSDDIFFDSTAELGLDAETDNFLAEEDEEESGEKASADEE